MARSPSDTDYTVDVDGIGTFTFGQRKMADHIKINVEYARLLEGVTPTPWLDTLTQWVSTLKVLMVRAPEGFVLEDLDPLEDSAYAKLFKVYTALRAKEDSFRPGSKAASEGAGTPAG